MITGPMAVSAALLQNLFPSSNLRTGQKHGLAGKSPACRPGFGTRSFLPHHPAASPGANFPPPTPDAGREPSRKPQISPVCGPSPPGSHYTICLLYFFFVYSRFYYLYLWNVVHPACAQVCKETPFLGVAGDGPASTTDRQRAPWPRRRWRLSIFRGRNPERRSGSGKAAGAVAEEENPVHSAAAPRAHFI